MDNFKKYLKENEPNLSVEEITDDIWVNIREGIQNKRAPSDNFFNASLNNLKTFLSGSWNYKPFQARYRLQWALALVIPVLIFSCAYRVNRAEVIGGLLSFTISKSSEIAFKQISEIEKQHLFKIINYDVSNAADRLSYITFVKKEIEKAPVISTFEKVPTIDRLAITSVESRINESLFSALVHKLFNVHVDARKPAASDLKSIIKTELKNKGFKGVDVSIQNGEIKLISMAGSNIPDDDKNTDIRPLEQQLMENNQERKKVIQTEDTTPANPKPVVIEVKQTVTPPLFTKEDYNWLHRSLTTSSSWRAIRKGDDIIFYISDPGLNPKETHWRTTPRFKLAETGLHTEVGEVNFTMRREAGTVIFKGTFNDDKGEGNYSFNPNEAFQSYLAANDFKDIDTDVMLKMFLSNINQEYIIYLKENGYKNLSTYNLRALANHFISINYLKNFFSLFKIYNYENVTLNQLIAFKIHGVTTDFIKAFIELGYKLSLDEATSMAIHGVKPSFIKQIKENGYPNITLSQGHKLKMHGVSLEYIQGFKDLGYKNISLNDALQFKMQGVTTSFIKSFHELGFDNVTLAQVIQIKMRGLTAGFIKSARQKGYNNLSIDEYVKLKEGR